MNNEIFPQKNGENELFNEKIMKESFKNLQNAHPSSFSADVLILGLPSSGKSLLMRRFENLNEEISTDTQETVGTDISKINYKNSKIVVREAGFQVLNIWEKYCKESKLILFLVDSSNYSQFADSLIEFMNLIVYTDKFQRPLGLIFTKMDNMNSLHPSEFEDVMEIEGLKEARKDLLIHYISSLTGFNVEILLEWINNVLGLFDKNVINQKKVHKNNSCFPRLC